jgi:hypothetical protein
MRESKSLGAVGYRFSTRIIKQAVKSAVNQIGTPILQTLSYADSHNTSFSSVLAA